MAAHTDLHSKGDQPRVALELPLILPDIGDHDDACVERLIDRLTGVRGIIETHIEQTPEQPRLCLHYDPNLVALGKVERLARDAGAELTRRYRHETLAITGMDCADCAQSIEHVLRRVPGVLQVSVSYPAEKMRLEFDSTLARREQILERVTSMGFEAHAQTPQQHGWLARHAELVRSILAGLVLALGFGLARAGFADTITLPVYALSYLLGGYDIARHGIKALAKGRFTIDLLMTVAAVGAASLGQWAEGGLLLFLFSLGHALEEEAMDSARHAISALGELTPKTARSYRDGRIAEVDVAELVRGDLVLVRAGERIPVDGIIREGRSAVDESTLTGESLPVAKDPGAEVFAGSINGDGTLEVETTKLASDTTLARVISLVSEAETQKSPTQQTVDRIAGVFVPATLVSVGLVWTLPPILGWLTWSEAFLRSMAVLVSASPCALAIATPAAVLSALARAANHGVLIKGGVHLENLGRLRALALDKTGTITRGAPSVTDLWTAGSYSEEELLGVAASVEAQSSHPLARAILEKAAQKSVSFPKADRVENLPGRGLRARIEGAKVVVGTADFVRDEISRSLGDLEEETKRLEAQGRTVVVVARNAEPLGGLAIADEPRENARETVARLRDLGIHELVMLTGDQPAAANAIATRVGITNVHAGLLPEDKLSIIQELAERHGEVAMIGDGVNDAPALARASVGIAMGAAGTDVALETADVALMADDLSVLPFTVGLGRQTRRVITQNLIASLGVIAVLVPLSLLGIAGIGIAIVLHEGSTLAVVGNALRLLRYRT